MYRARSEQDHQEGVMLRQSSWGSREPLAEEQTHARVFIKNRDLWEKRAGSSPSSDEVSHCHDIVSHDHSVVSQSHDHNFYD